MPTDTPAKLPRHKDPKRKAYQLEWKRKKAAALRALPKDNTLRQIQAQKTRNKHLKRKYGITGLDYDNMLEAQRGLCALCEKPPSKRRLAVDHNHKTGRVRALLCFRCNYFRIGHVSDIHWARKILAYFEKYESPVTDDNLVKPGQTVDQG